MDFGLVLDIAIFCATAAAAKWLYKCLFGEKDKTNVDSATIASFPSTGTRNPDVFYRVFFVSQDATGQSALIDVPAFQELIHLFRSTKRNLDISTWILCGTIIVCELTHAASRGVHVRVIFDEWKQEDKRKNGSGAPSAGQLRAAGIDVREYKGTCRSARRLAADNPKWATAKGNPVRRRTPQKALFHFHRKGVIADGNMVMFGSCNMSENSFVTHIENLAFTNDQRFVEPFMQEFQRTWHDFS